MATQKLVVEDKTVDPWVLISASSVQHLGPTLMNHQILGYRVLSDKSFVCVQAMVFLCFPNGM